MDRQCPSCGGFCKKSGCERENTKPKRDNSSWVGLTKEEMLELFEKYSDRPFSLMLATHDKVKEKNT